MESLSIGCGVVLNMYFVNKGASSTFLLKRGGAQVC